MRNQLFIKLSIVFLLILIAVGGIITYISQYTARQYHLETNQKLHAELAQYTVDHLPNTFTADGQIDTTSIQDLMHSMMVINPDVEVYLLDNSGKILSHVAPYKKVVRDRVDLGPVIQFVDSEGALFIEGDDPRDQLGKKVFSAAPFIKDDEIKGYYYIILASQEKDAVMSSLKNTYAWKLGSKLMLITLVGSLILGLFAFWYMTRNLSKIKQVMEKFRRGDYSARIADDQKGDFAVLGDTYNSMASTIQQNIEKIVSIDSFRKELIANISHDLRTPLSIIQGYTETLLMKKDTLPKNQQEEYLDNIHESSKQLVGLVNQLFELSKLESNQIKVHKEPFPLQELTLDMAHRFEILAEQKNIQLEFEPVKDLPLVYADIGLVERVIQNILDNALKFTPEKGKITIKLYHDQNHVKVDISDTGKGIPKNRQSAIFERYIKSEPSEKQKVGSGLGLAIAKKIMELHDSTIQVKSKLDVGSTFRFELPVYTA